MEVPDTSVLQGNISKFNSFTSVCNKESSRRTEGAQIGGVRKQGAEEDI